MCSLFRTVALSWGDDIWAWYNGIMMIGVGRLKKSKITCFSSLRPTSLTWDHLRLNPSYRDEKPGSSSLSLASADVRMFSRQVRCTHVTRMWNGRMQLWIFIPRPLGSSFPFVTVRLTMKIEIANLVFRIGTILA